MRVKAVEMYFRQFRKFFAPIPSSWHWYGEKMRQRTTDGKVVFRDPTSAEVEALEEWQDNKAW